jgi:2-oxoisovalerate dehydrogenase E2 component (dihydrolipoyl transacylase)
MGQFLLPDLGEGLEEAQLVQWLVAEGDTVTLNQPLCQVETAKALVDIPSPYAGTVTAFHAQPGATVAVGAPLLTIAAAGSDATPAVGSGAAAVSTAERPSGEGGPVLVGYGTEGPAQTFARRRRGTAPATSTAAPGEAQGTSPATEPSASPLVRKVAAERGIDLRTIQGSGPGGRIRMEDLETATTDLTPRPSLPAGEMMARSAGGVAATEDEERISTVGLRKAIAARMVRSATTIPQFTEYSLFDASALLQARERLKDAPALAGVRLTFLPFFVRALVQAVTRYPILNSRWDDEGNAIVVKKAINVGIATDTPRGLLVPVIHDAQTLDLSAIAREANRLVELTRAGTITAPALTGGTITITNVGAAGPVDTGAPLINPPEACVVGLGAIKPRAVVVGERVEARPSCWLSISCDHRIVDGATAAQFMGALVEALERPEG